MALTEEEREAKRAAAAEKAWEKEGRETRKDLGGKAQKVQEVIGSIGSGIRTLMPRGMKDPNRMVRNPELYVGGGTTVQPLRGITPRLDKTLLLPSSSRLQQPVKRPSLGIGMDKNLVLPRRMRGTKPLKRTKKVTFRKPPKSRRPRIRLI